MKNLIILTLILLSVSSRAQVLIIGGVNSFRLTKVNESEAGFGYQLGINYLTLLGEANTGFITGLEVENIRSTLSTEFYGERFLSGKNFETYKHSTSFLKVPAYLDFPINPDEKFSLIGGIKFSFLLQNQQEPNDKIDYGLEFQKFNISLGVGAKYIPDNFGAKIEVQHSILPVIDIETGTSLNWVDNVKIANGFSVAFSFLILL
jgi:hypothetical protein